MKTVTIDRLSSLWTQQLHLEFEDICWQYNIGLTPPAFEISKSKKTLGSWNAATSIISMSGFLILDHSWDVTINILKHEIAHQICSEIFSSQEVAHGPDFQRACELLGLSKEYQRAGGDLPGGFKVENNASRLTSAGRQYIVKIEKLLALAKSSNEHEAVLAMEKANEIMLKYNISQLNSREIINYTYKIINKKKKRIESYQKIIGCIIRDFFHVKIVFASMYDPLLNQSHKTIEIFGSCENVAVAEYCYHFLDNQLATLWNRNRHLYKGKTRTEKNSYYLGLLHGFRDKLQKQKDVLQDEFKFERGSSQGNSKVTGLMVIDDKRIDIYVSKRFPKLSTAKRAGISINKNTYEEAIVEGGKITLHKGVSEKDGNQGKFLC